MRVVPCALCLAEKEKHILILRSTNSVKGHSNWARRVQLMAMFRRWPAVVPDLLSFFLCCLSLCTQLPCQGMLSCHHRTQTRQISLQLSNVTGAQTNKQTDNHKPQMPQGKPEGGKHHSSEQVPHTQAHRHMGANLLRCKTIQVALALGTGSACLSLPPEAAAAA